MQIPKLTVWRALFAQWQGRQFGLVKADDFAISHVFVDACSTCLRGTKITAQHTS